MTLTQYSLYTITWPRRFVKFQEVNTKNKTLCNALIGWILPHDILKLFRDVYNLVMMLILNKDMVFVTDPSRYVCNMAFTIAYRGTAFRFILVVDASVIKATKEFKIKDPLNI